MLTADKQQSSVGRRTWQTGTGYREHKNGKTTHGDSARSSYSKRYLSSQTGTGDMKQGSDTTEFNDHRHLSMTPLIQQKGNSGERIIKRESSLLINESDR
ncbi:hypothetical protein M1D97_10145 [Kushneria sp. AK178]